jgi:hypothetical protein
LYSKTTQLYWINLKLWSTKGFYRSYDSTQASPKPSHSHSHPNHTIWSKEDPRPLVTVSTVVMIVVHFTKVSALYPWVVISSLAKQLEKPLFCHSYTSFGVWPRDHYMPLQRFTMGCMPGLAKLVRSTIALLRFPGVVCGTTAPHALCEPWRVTTPISHSSEQGTLPIASLISEQDIPYRTRGGTCCPGVSTPQTRSLADSSMTNHKLWRSQPSPPFQTLLKPQHRISRRSPHITIDGRPTLSTLNTSQTQHHKDGKTCTMTQRCRAKQCY